MYFEQEPSTLGEMFAERVRLTPEAIALFARDQELSLAALDRSARTIGAWLREEAGVEPRDRVCLLLDNGPGFFECFWAAILIGAVPVPLSSKSGRERLGEIAANCQAKVAVIEDEAVQAYSCSNPLEASAETLLIGCEDLRAAASRFTPIVGPPYPLTAEDFGFLQYTSGTTGASKGVALSHRALLANLRGLMARMGVRPREDVFSVLIPMYHDMGLIGFGLGSLYANVKLVLFRQDIRNIYRWLESFKLHGATISGCSNTILHLTTRAVLDTSQYNLSGLRMMIVGSEPVNSQTVQRFQTSYGLSDITAPAYGLAEICLCASMTAPGEPIRTDANGFVACGRPLDQVEIRIAAPVDATPAAPGATPIGEVLLRTPSAMSGYFGRFDANSEVFSDGFLHTGDLGYLDSDGYLYICGRQKNLINRGGKNHAPHELEEVAARVKDVRLAAVVQVPPDSAGREDVYLVIEVATPLLKKPERLQELYATLYREAAAHCAYQPDRVLFTKIASIPHSLNGKLQHGRLRELLLSGQLAEEAQLYPR